MKLEEKIQADLVSAMKSKEGHAVSALRSVKAAIQNEKVNGVYHELTDADVLKLIERLVKQRKESIDIYSQAGRRELADNEQQEMLVLANYLPKKMGKEEVESAIEGIISETGASSMKDMGNIMKLLKERYAGQYDGKEASLIIKDKLNN